MPLQSISARKHCINCNQIAMLCECLNGFESSTSSSNSDSVSRLSQGGCKLCFGPLPAGSMIAKQVGNWDNGFETIEVWHPWKHRLCRACLMEMRRNAKSARASIALGAKLRVMGQLFHDFAKITYACAFSVVRAMGGWWNYLAPDAKPLANLPSQWLYRVGIAQPSVDSGRYFMLASNQCATTGQWTQSNSRGLDE